MAKKSSTINLEMKIWNLIYDYMEANEIDNRNTAIEYMLLEQDSLSKLLKRGSIAVESPTIEAKTEKSVSKNSTPKEVKNWAVSKDNLIKNLNNTMMEDDE